MRVAYITRVSVHTKAAQSIQISRMSDAFLERLGSDQFTFYDVDAFLQKYRRALQFLSKFKIVRNIVTILYYFETVHQTSRHHDSIVYTRDYICIFVCRFFKVPCVYEVHHLFENKLSSLLFHAIKKYLDLKIVYISDGVKSDFENVYTLSCPSLVAHDGFQISTKNSETKITRRIKAFKKDFRKIVIHCGKLDYSKGVDIFFDLAVHFPEVAFIQIGGFRTEKDKDLFVGKWDKHNTFVFDDVPNNNILNILRKADVLFFPMSRRNKYWKHTSPLKLFEYLGSGVPIVGSFIGSVVEISKNYDLIEFNPDDVDDAKAKLTDCFLNIRVNKSNAETIRSRAELQYTWTRRVENIIHWIETGSPQKTKTNKT